MKKNPFQQPIIIDYKQSGHTTPLSHQQPVQTYFKQPSNPIYVDLGISNGQFLANASERYPDINWVGVDHRVYKYFQAMKKYKLHSPNLICFWMEYKQLDQLFQPGEVQRFYINFCNWDPNKPKSQLTYRKALQQYERLLSPTGDLILKTDYSDLYAFTLEELKECDWEILEQSEDFIFSPWTNGNVSSLWEDRVDAHDYPIFYLRVKPSR